MHTSEGHRQRVKDRYRKEGLDNFNDVHVLELLLFYAVPRIDTKPLARALLDHFGSLSQVLEADMEELEKVPGIGPNASTLLSLTTAVGRYYLVSRSTPTGALDTVDKCGTYLANFFYGRRNEVVYLLCLDAKGKRLCCRKLCEGSVNSSHISIRRIMEVVMSVGATSVVLAHNHPSGLALPSPEDAMATRRIAAALDAVDVTLVDHIVVADGDYVSMAQSGNYCASDCRLTV